MRTDPTLVVVAAFVVAAGITLHWRLGPEDTYWTIDNGGKAIVLANLAEDPTRSWIRYPGEERDPDFRWFPQPLGGDEPYGRVRDGRVESQYLSPFLWLTLPFYRLFGFHGLAVVPALAAGVAVFLTGRLARRRTGSARVGRVAAVLLMLATPLFFYAAVFWEHTLVAALAAGGFLALEGARPKPAMAGASFGAAALFRVEAALLVVAAAVVLAALRRPRGAATLLLAAGVGVGARLLFHGAQQGSVFGLHVQANRPELLRSAGDAFAGLLVGTGFSGVPLAVPIGALAVAAAAALSLRDRPAGRALSVIATVVLAVVTALAWLRFPGGEDHALALIHSSSMLVFLPWALVLPLGNGNRPGLASATAIGFVLLFVALVPARSITGVHPGPRMLWPVLPLAAALAAERLARQRWRPGAIAFAALLVPALAWNIRSLELLAGKRRAVGEVAAAISRDPHRVVVTDLFWLPTELAALWDRKDFHLVSGPGELDRFLSSLPGGEPALLVTAPGRAGRAAPVAASAAAAFPEFAVELHALQGTGR